MLKRRFLRALATWRFKKPVQGPARPCRPQFRVGIPVTQGKPRALTVGAHSASYVDRHLENGVTYYYAIAAFDDDRNESDLSPESVFDTPRPEGRDLYLYNSLEDARHSGYDFSSYRVVSFQDVEADLYFWWTEEDGAWMIATERSADSYTDLQDAGYGGLEAVDYAPADGWAPTGEVPLIEGHCYVVWTWDDHYSKFRVVQLRGDRVVLDWAYQVDRSNRELRAEPIESRSPQAQGKHLPGGGLRIHQVGAAAAGTIDTREGGKP